MYYIYSRHCRLSQFSMASESKPHALHTGAPYHEDKQASETLVEAYPVTKGSDPPSLSDEFPEGGLAAWITVLGS